MEKLLQQRQQYIKKHFQESESDQEKYQKILSFGKRLPLLELEHREARYQVPGCQSLLYLRTEQTHEGLLTFSAYSDALISKGLTAIVIYLYNALPAETILSSKTTLIEDLQIQGGLSLHRSNGLANIYLKIKKDAIIYLN